MSQSSAIDHSLLSSVEYMQCMRVPDLLTGPARQWQARVRFK